MAHGDPWEDVDPWEASGMGPYLFDLVEEFRAGEVPDLDVVRSGNLASLLVVAVMGAEGLDALPDEYEGPFFVDARTRRRRRSRSPSFLRRHSTPREEVPEGVRLLADLVTAYLRRDVDAFALAWFVVDNETRVACLRQLIANAIARARETYAGEEGE